MKKTVLSLFLSLSLVGAANANTNSTCRGAISKVSIGSNGVVFGTIEGPGVSIRDSSICSVEPHPNPESQTTVRFNPATCKAMVQMLLSASERDQEVTLWFDPEHFVTCEFQNGWESLINNGLIHMRIED